MRTSRPEWRLILPNMLQCLHGLSGVNYALLAAERLRTVHFDALNDRHEEMLGQLWMSLRPGVLRAGRVSEDWKTIGFLVRMVVKARMNPFGFFTSRNLIAEDGERHAAMRAIVNRGFTPRRIRDWEQRVEALASDLAGQLPYADEFDVIRDLAVPLPVTIIAEILGVPPEDIDQFNSPAICLQSRPYFIYDIFNFFFQCHLTLLI